MNKFFFIVYLLFCAFAAQAQTYTFECFNNAYMTGDSCTICPNTVYKSQSFSGLMIYRDGVKFRWIDEPYLIRLRPNNLVEFIEQAISTPDKISIPLANTDFTTVQGFIDSTFCEGASFDYVFYYNDGVGTVAVNSGDTLTITGGGTDLTYTGTSSPVTLNSSTGADVTVTGGTGIGLSATTTNMTVTNTAPDQTVSITGTGITVGGTYPNFTLTAADQSATNENLTISVGANSENLGGQTLNVTGTGIAVPTYTPATNTLNIAAVEVDGSTTNEIQNLSLAGQSLGISGGTGVTLPVVGISAGAGIGVSSSSGVFTITNNGDLSSTNEAQSLTVATNTATLSDVSGVGGGSVTIAGGGINSVATAGTTITVTGTEVDGSITNENLTISVGANSENLGGQTLNVTGTGIAVPTYTPATNTLNIGAVEVDGSITNESLTITVGANSENLGGQTLNVTGTGIATPSYTLATNTLNIAATEVDGSVSNEGILGVGLGLSNTAVITSNTSTANGISIVGGTGISITETTGTNGGDITVGLSVSPWFVGGNTLTATGTIGSNSNHAVQIETNGTSKVHVSTDGKVGINNDTPSTSLDLSNNSDGILMQSGNNASRPAIGSVLRRNGNGVLEFSNTSSDWGVIIAQVGVSQTVGNGLGTTPTFGVLSGSTILSGRYQFTVGTSPSTDGTAFLINLPAGVFTHIPSAVVGAGNKQAAIDIAKFYTTCTTTSVGVFVNGTLTAGATYILNLQVQN